MKLLIANDVLSVFSKAYVRFANSLKLRILEGIAMFRETCFITFPRRYSYPYCSSVFFEDFSCFN